MVSIVIPIKSKLSEELDDFINHYNKLKKDMGNLQVQIVIANESNNYVYKYMENNLNLGENDVHFAPSKNQLIGANNKSNGVIAALEHTIYENIILIDDHYRISKNTIIELVKYFEQYYCCSGPGADNFYENKKIIYESGLTLADPEDIVITESGVYSKKFNGTLDKIDILNLKVSSRFVIHKQLYNAINNNQLIVLNLKASLLPMDKGIYCYMEKLIQYYLDEEPILKQPKAEIVTCKKQLDNYYENIINYVIKKRAGMGGKQVLICNESSEEELDKWYKDILDKPYSYIIQEKVDFNQVEINEKDKRYYDLRIFAMIGSKVHISTDIMTRIASSGTMKVNISSGGAIADTWIRKEKK